MNREDIKPGDCLKLSYNVVAGPQQGEYRTGMGYATEREGKIHINAAWADGTVNTTSLDFMGDHVEFRILSEERKPRTQADFMMQDWKKHPARREAYHKLDINNWETMIKYIFGTLEPGDIIIDTTGSEIICLASIENGNTKGYKLTSRGKWSNKLSNVYGLGVGYQKLVRDI
jgi:hypothetical protein